MFKPGIFLLLISLFVFIRSSIAQTSSTRVFIVRHADREKTDDLNPLGVVRATELKRVLADTGIDSIFSTNFIRTQKTVRPLSAALNLPVTRYDNDTLLIQRILSSSEGKTVIVAGHSNTVPQMVRLCGCKPPFENIPDTQFDDIFLVVIQQEKVKKSKRRTCKLMHMKYGAVTTAEKLKDANKM